jgi:hypothetical protein
MTPPNGPRAVEEAREATEVLAAQVPQDRASIDRAKSALLEAEATDRKQLAAAMREGATATSDISAISQAREAVGGAERTWQARQLALADADQELHATVEASAAEWARSARATAERARRNARKTLERLTAELEQLAQAQATAWWLGHLNSQQPPPSAVLGSAPGSAFAQANGSAVSGNVLLSWVAELVDPPERQQPVLHAAAVVGE